jgi:hypothetical protein
MKIGWLLALVSSAISLAVSSFGQQTDAIDPQIAQEIRELTMKYEDALNEHDAEAAAAFFTADAVWTTPQGTFYGRRSIERRLANYLFSAMAYYERGHYCRSGNFSWRPSTCDRNME